jgi:hypothetical protein
VYPDQIRALQRAAARAGKPVGDVAREAIDAGLGIPAPEPQS